MPGVGPALSPFRSAMRDLESSRGHLERGAVTSTTLSKLLISTSPTVSSVTAPPRSLESRGVSTPSERPLYRD